MKTALVVGGSSGIGLATIELLLKENIDVINVSRTPCALGGVKNRICNVAERENFDKILTELAPTRIDYFIYSAGFSMASPLEYVLEGDYRYLYEVNFFAFVHALQVLLPSLIKSKGVIVAVSSLGATIPIPFDEYYSSSKSALNAFIDTISYELNPLGVKIYSLMPGGTKTGFTFKRKVYSPSEVDGYSKLLSLACDNLAKTEQKGVTPDKVAKKILCLCKNSRLTTTVSAPLINKILRGIYMILPYPIKRALIRATYFMEEE